MEKAYVFLADGFEEIEGLTVVDILRQSRCRYTDRVDHGTQRRLTGSHGIHGRCRCSVCIEVNFF